MDLPGFLDLAWQWCLCLAAMRFCWGFGCCHGEEPIITCLDERFPTEFAVYLFGWERVSGGVACRTCSLTGGATVYVSFTGSSLVNIDGNPNVRVCSYFGTGPTHQRHIGFGICDDAVVQVGLAIRSQFNDGTIAGGVESRIGVLTPVSMGTFSTLGTGAVERTMQELTDGLTSHAPLALSGSDGSCIATGADEYAEITRV